MKAHEIPNSDVTPDAMRAAARAKIFEPGEMLIGADTSRVHLLDVSRTGALVHAESPPPVGTMIRLSCIQPLGRARVVWVVGKRFGVVFSAMLPVAQLDMVVQGQGRAAARPVTQA